MFTSLHRFGNGANLIGVIGFLMFLGELFVVLFGVISRDFEKSKSKVGLRLKLFF
jgi:hypothetical protein